MLDNHCIFITGAKTSEWKMGRRVIDRSKGGSTFELIGGPEEINPNQWQSEAQSLTSKKKATIDQLTETGRSMHVCGKKSSVPAYENVSPFTDSVASRLRDENPYSLNENSSSNTCRSKAPHEHVNGKENLIGYRAPRAGNSFLAGLGKKLATDRL